MRGRWSTEVTTSCIEALLPLHILHIDPHRSESEAIHKMSCFPQPKPTHLAIVEMQCPRVYILSLVIVCVLPLRQRMFDEGWPTQGPRAPGAVPPISIPSYGRFINPLGGQNIAAPYGLAPGRADPRSSRASERNGRRAKLICRKCRSSIDGGEKITDSAPLPRFFVNLNHVWRAMYMQL